jgi:hypothetical protein
MITLQVGYLLFQRLSEEALINGRPSRRVCCISGGIVNRDEGWEGLLKSKVFSTKIVLNTTLEEYVIF